MYRTLPVFIGSLVVEVVKLVIVMSGIFNFTLKKDNKRVVLSTVITLIVSSVAFLLLSKVNYVALLVPVTAMFLACIFIADKKKIIHVFLAEISLSGIDEMINNIVQKYIESEYSGMISISVTVIFVSMISYFLQYRRKGRMDESVKNIGNFYLVTLILAQFVVGYYASVINSRTGFSRLWLFVMIAVILFVEAVMIYSLNRKNYYFNLSMINQQLLKNQEQYYMKLLAHENEVRSFRHDVKNHLLSIKALIAEEKYDEASEYISELEDSLALKKSAIRTGNTVVSAIASDYAERYPSVEIKWNGLVPEELNISNVDICTIFSNILANAFENAVKSEKEKKVDVKIETVTNNMIVTVLNSVGVAVKEKDGVFETTKDDKQIHGIGTRNVRKTVEANKGIIEYNYNSEIFEIKIILPNVLKLF